MREWGIALLAAGSALLGSVVTGWFTRGAGHRQAEAARHAGDRQADALLETVRLTLEEQRASRVHEARRQTYARFLEAVEAVLLARRTGEGQPTDRSALQRAFGTVLLEGPDDVARIARELMNLLGGSRSLDDLERERRSFIEAAQRALGRSNRPE
ncbi:hypothetical protein ACFOOM_08635 [Streptomyces echinoruber]|uniref:Uncharacterized protein n=1 Tax=Streptomyces echinoruber TaxID=68898 RepID=A0A918RC63_9ACTN|nr:hypothetical protein [Streptomyces echinoruber]GGZ89977.1 hypothetical protein GCM10010389_30430 [Streptomyces echinoruber]